jgi:hypothetical protein
MLYRRTVLVFEKFRKLFFPPMKLVLDDKTFRKHALWPHHIGVDQTVLNVLQVQIVSLEMHVCLETVHQ